MTSGRSSPCWCRRIGSARASRRRCGRTAEQARIKRRQNAEESAAKLSVKLVIPLVFFLFPALYVVILGPAFIKITNVFSGGAIGGLR